MSDVKTEDRLQDAQKRSAELIDTLFERGAKLGELRTLDPAKRTETWDKDLRSALTDVKVLDAELSVTLRTIDALDTDRNVRTVGGSGPKGATQSGPQARTMGEIVAADKDLADWVKQTRGAGVSPEVQVRTLLDTAGTGSTGSNLWMPVGTPYLSPNAVQRRRLFIRDVLPSADTSLASVPYIRELNSDTNALGATTVAEGAVKPEVTMAFTSADAPIRKIAAWIPVTSEILEDAPLLRGYIDARLGYMLALREEDQLLNGNGTAPNLRGIRQTVGLQTQAAVIGDFVVTLGNAIAKIENVDGDADGIAMNPADYWSMVTKRQSDGHFDQGSPYGSLPASPWGLPVIRTRSLPVGKALVGSWGLGAQILDRSSATVKVSDQHANYFVENKVALLIEKRLGLAVYRPDFFVEATLALV